MKKINILSVFLIFNIFLFYSYISASFDKDNLEKYKTPENIAKFNTENKSGEEFLSEIKTEEEIVNWLQIAKINEEIKKDFGDINKISEQKYDEIFSEKLQKFPKEEFYIGKEKEINLGKKIIENKEILEKEFKKLNLEEKYFVTNYIRHKNLSNFLYSKEVMILNGMIDEISKEQKEKGIFIMDLSEEEILNIFYEKLDKNGLDLEYLICPLLNKSCENNFNKLRINKKFLDYKVKDIIFLF